MFKSKFLRFLASAGSLFLLLIGSTAISTATAFAATSGPTSHPITVNPVYQPAGTPKDAAFGCQTDRGPDAIVCYSPQQIQHAYHIDTLMNHGINGKGRTVVIVDAFQNPTMQSDLAAFDSVFGLPAPVFTQVAPDGLTPFDPNDANQVGWAGEIALDVQWAHAMAPGAAITLVLAKSNQDADLLSVTKYAVDHNLGDVISQSFGENENCVDPQLLKQEHAVFAAAAAKHITVLASSGDQGAAQQTCDGTSWTQVASSPASDPLVTAVGGTELFAAPDCSTAFPCPTTHPTPGTYDHEIVLNEAPGDFTEGSFSTGGGFSDLYKRPAYQLGISAIPARSRGVPDISFTGSINHGVLASCGACAGVTTPAFFIFGGTSVGSPCWGGLVALIDQIGHHRAGFLNNAIYAVGHTGSLFYHDTTVGNNSVQEPDATDTLVSVPGFNALKGWDAATGWGTPKADTLLPLLALLTV
ncbi:MAG TPA: S53 family peptidase [Ktedonobacteraceae bacterium]|nr:S53 family peptidase [Ktedonobacteraceae bacterium]